jgi:uncharacterized protein
VTRFLLDVNVLIALVDPAHVQHDRAHEWFARVGRERFSTCPITENGLLRIVGHPKYPNSPGSPGAAMAALIALRTMPGHEFWADTLSIADGSQVDALLLSSHAQVTDTYLLALARAHGGRLATLDRRLVVDAVRGGRNALELI